MDVETIRAIEAILQKGDRVELIPVKEGVKVTRIRREMVHTESFMSPARPGAGDVSSRR